MDVLFPIVIGVAVALVMGLFAARAKGTPVVEQDGHKVFKQATGNCHLRISEQGVHRDPTWGFGGLLIRWEDIVDVEENTGNQAITIRSCHGKKIKHYLHAAPEEFRRIVQQRAKLPLTVATPGIWKVHKTQIPYQEQQ